MVRFTVVRDTGKRAVLLAFLKVSPVKLYLNGYYYKESGYGSFFYYFKDLKWVVYIVYLLIGILLT